MDLILRAESHGAFDAGTVIPGAVDDFACCRQAGNAALEVQPAGSATSRHPGQVRARVPQALPGFGVRSHAGRRKLLALGP